MAALVKEGRKKLAKPLKAKTLVKVPKQTEKDKRNPQARLVPIAEKTDADPLVSKYVLPDTYYRYTDGVSRPNCMITVLPGGTRVGWSECGNCQMNIHVCRCSAGIHTSRGVEYLYDQAVAYMAGEEWGPHHKNYKGSVFHAERKRKAERGGKLAFPQVVKPVEVVESDWRSHLPKRPKPLAKAVALPKPLPKAATDKKALDRAAKKIESSLEAQVAKVMGLPKPAPKKLTKKAKKK